jgi:RNA polymerase sigma-B factor
MAAELDPNTNATGEVIEINNDALALSANAMAEVIELDSRRTKALGNHALSHTEHINNTGAEFIPAQEELVIRFMPLALHIAAKQIKKGGIPPSDYDSVMSDSLYGLVRAARKFHTDKVPDNATTSSNYFYNSIMGEILHGMRDRLGRSPAIYDKETKEVIDHGGRVQRLKPSVTSGTAKSFDKPVSVDDPDGLTFGDIFSPGDKDNLNSILAGADVKTILKEMPARNREIFFRYHYLDQTQYEIAGQIGLSQMQVSRIIRELRAAMKYKLREAYQP